ncbi:hypothetical protein DB347_09480 [Opitutaceae bacterium EW11]|nr:hypothetical protein DB347_09480 [Opitutaceae bacterium EW11]
MRTEGTESFSLQANYTWTPYQFFTVCLPWSSIGCARIVGFAIRTLLGYCDRDGIPQRETLRFTYEDFIQGAGVSRGALAGALREAVDGKFLRRLIEPGERQSPVTGTYAINWDKDGAYTDDPDKFAGFCFQGARKNIPNLFFDRVLATESRAVARLVGAVLFRSIEFGEAGDRPTPVSLSITRISRLTKISRTHAHAAIEHSLAVGYLRVSTCGRFDAEHPSKSSCSSYELNWGPIAKSAGASHAEFKKDYGRVQKGERGGSKRCTRTAYKKVNEGVRKGERQSFKKVNDLRTEKIRNTAAELPIAAAAPSIQPLLQAGFDRAAAERLASSAPPEVISRQIEWLPRRKTTSNRLGLLRKSIEENWPEPPAAHDFATMRRKEYRTTSDTCKAEHMARHADEYLAYLREEEPRVREELPGLYAEFLAAFESRNVEALERARKGGVIDESFIAACAASWATDEARLDSFGKFFGDHTSAGIMGFWVWDEAANKQTLQRPA